MIDIPEEVRAAYEILTTSGKEMTAMSVLVLFLVRQMTDLYTQDEQYRNGLLHILGRMVDLLKLPKT